MQELPEIVKSMGYLLPQKISAILRLKDVFAKFKKRSYKKSPIYKEEKRPAMKQACIKIFKDGLDLIMDDMIDNNITLKIPTYSDQSAELSIQPAKEKSENPFKEPEYVGLYLTMISKYKKLIKMHLWVGEKWRNRIDENVKNGKLYY